MTQDNLLNLLTLEGKDARASKLIEEHRQAIYRRTDRIFLYLMPLQWLGAIVLALFVSPLTWQGEVSSVHPHVLTALIFGGLVTILPVVMALVQPGGILTRHVIAAGQVLMSALLIHLSGGRIETHFHVFGSLAFLAFYRDWRVLITASAVVAADHLLRGMFWPVSVYGTAVGATWRWVEHAWWVIFESVFLTISIVQSNKADVRQAQLEITNELIEQAVAERTVELEASKELAESANRAKSEFLAGMSHELRTPLNAIIGFSELLTEQIFGPLNEKQADYSQNILNSGRHLLRLINDLLDLAKVEAGRMELELTEVHIPHVLRDVEAIGRALAARKNLDIKTQVQADCPSLLADAAKLKQVLFNLLSNAVKFSPQGGTITISAALHPEERVPGNENSSGVLRISVTDTGIGMSPADQERIFADFVQVDASLSRRHEGTGLGLAMARKLVELHGGRITVASEGEGSGSTFTVDLPVRAPKSIPQVVEVPAPAEPIAIGATPLHPTRRPFDRRILLVEDDQSARRLLSQYLSDAGYDVTVAVDGEEAVRLARELAPYAIVLDMVLPHRDGWYVLSELKAHLTTRHIPVVVVSITEDRKGGLALGAAEWLVKPVDRRRLLAAVEFAVESTDKRQGTVLVVDDDPGCMQLITALLESRGYEVLQAANGQAGIDLALEKKPSGIVLDLMMPGVTGFDVVRKLQEHPEAADIPVFIYTSEDLSLDEQRSLQGATTAVLSKSSSGELMRELEKSAAGHS